MMLTIIDQAYYECDSRFIATHFQPACLIDLALSRQTDIHRLLKGTGLFYEDILSGGSRICPAQFLKLIANAERLLDDEDISFLFGQRSLPGHHGAASHALRQSANLQSALELLTQLSPLLTPLSTPRLWHDEQHTWLYWTDTCHTGEQQKFLLESGMAAVVSLCRSLSGQRLPWEFFFTHAQPRYVEQYWVHLGQTLHFKQPMNLMRIARSYLQVACRDTSATACQAALREGQLNMESTGCKTSFMDLVYSYLHENIQQPPPLGQLADAFQMSPSTLKRKLQKHGSGFQAQLDMVRTHKAIYLYWIKGYNNDQVTEYLCFHDTTNFRRSFKRWTGLLPSDLKEC